MVQGLVRYPGAGCVVEFMQGNAPQIAWVLEEQNGRLRLLLPNRRETALQAARILPWPGPAYEKNCSRDAALEILERHKSRREVANVDPLELWELAQGEVEQAPAQWFAELAMSEPDMDAVAACGHALMQAKSHFKFNPPNFEVYPESVVATRMAELEAARRREELVNKGSSFIRLLWEIHQKKSTQSPGRAAESLDPDVRERLRRTIMNRIADPETSEDDGLWKLMVKGLPDDPFMPLYLAQAWGLVEPHHNYWMDRAGYAPGNDWCEEHRDELDALLAQAAEDERQEPTFPDRPIISIDAPTTRDVDDAFFIEARPDGGAGLPGLPLAVRGEAGQGCLQPRHQHLSAGSHPPHASGSPRHGSLQPAGPKDAAFPAHRMHRGSRRPRGRVRTARRLCPPCGEPVL